MKKYKHKQTGKVVEQKDKIFVTSFDINSGKAQEIIPTWILENTNDWEEVFEKDYEILSLKNKAGSIINSATIRKDFTPESLYLKAKTTICEYNSDDFIIHSVKRLSDGEI